MCASSGTAPPNPPPHRAGGQPRAAVTDAQIDAAAAAGVTDDTIRAAVETGLTS